MKKVKFAMVLLLSGAIIFSGCSSSKMATTKNSTKGGIIGGAGGALLGAGIGALAGKGKGAAVGAAIGGVVGAGAGVMIGKKNG
jgi:hypothetical protein